MKATGTVSGDLPGIPSPRALSVLVDVAAVRAGALVGQSAAPSAGGCRSGGYWRSWAGRSPRASLYKESQGQVRGLRGRQPDAWSRFDQAPRPGAIVRQPQFSPLGRQVQPIVGARNAECLGQAAGPTAQVPLAHLALAVGASLHHELYPADRLGRAKQDCRGGPLRAAHDVGAPVHAVGEIDVQPARRAEHDGSPRSRAPEGVAARVIEPEVCLNLYEAGLTAVGTHQQLADELLRDLPSLTLEKLAP
jgi:hypothetical protein